MYSGCKSSSYLSSQSLFLKARSESRVYGKLEEEELSGGTHTRGKCTSLKEREKTSTVLRNVFSDLNQEKNVV